MATYYSTNLVDNSTGLVIANGYDSTLALSFLALILDITNNTTYTANFTASSATSSTLSDFEFKVYDDNCVIDSLSLWVFTSSNLTPSIIIDDYGTFILTLIEEGNCSERTCFTSDELEELYQKALNMCKICNCT